LLAGCGGDDGSREPRLDRAVAERLAAQSDAVADAIEANDGCAAAERAAALRRGLQEADVPETVRREVEPLASRTFTCVPPPPPPVPPAPVSTEEEGDDDSGKRKAKGHKKHKKDNGKGKKHGHDDEGDE
jgi:hypothetical protein